MNEIAQLHPVAQVIAVIASATTLIALFYFLYKINK